ncbi:MAG: hypothetical protein RIT27_1316 [Pseudomonadota bacterium]|jgi:superfamily I DNA and RNA helicase
MEFISGSISIKGSIGEKEIWKCLQGIFANKEGQCGYKKPSISVHINEVPSFIIISKEYGIVIIDVIDHKLSHINGDYWQFTNGDSFFSRDIILNSFSQEINTRLSNNSMTYDRRKQKALIPISKLLVFFQNNKQELEHFKEDLFEEFISQENFKGDLEQFFEQISKIEDISTEKYNKVISLLEGTDSLRNKLPQIKLPETKNDFIQRSLEETFKLDDVQRQVAMQIADGPQRIRGLAGTGKTVILCLKAAIAHQEFSNYKILFLFNTRSMYPQINDLISKYYTREAKQPVNWENVEVLHAWGGREQKGLYYNLCHQYGVHFLPFGRGVSLEFIFEDLLRKIREKLQPTYDLVLIDEAQDLPPSIFETIFYLTKGEPSKKRIVWAYDEFQTLTDIQIREPEDLFGITGGKPNLPNSILDGKYDLIDKDYILSNSYRNPRAVLMVAHGLALGLYRQKGDIECIKNKKTWNALGYKIIEPTNIENFNSGNKMVIERPEEFSKNKLENLLKEYQKEEQKLIQITQFLTINEEIAFIVPKIQEAITIGKIDPTEIIVVTLDTKAAKEHLSLIRQSLDRLNIASTMPGLIEDASIFKKKGTVTLTTPFRAKGNEANVVFIINAQKVVMDSLFRARNALFVAITRARGWCYISGNGNAMNELENEIQQILAKYPCFEFLQPSDEEVKRTRNMYDDGEIQEDKLTIGKIIGRNRELVIEQIINDHPDVAKAISAKAIKEDYE